MPSYCETILTIQGSSQSMNSFYQFFDNDLKENFKMEHSLPIPSELVGVSNDDVVIRKAPNWPFVEYLEVDLNNTGAYLVSKYGSCCEEDWKVNNWGTCSDILNLKLLSETSEECVLSYLSNYSTNDLFIMFLSRKFPMLNFWILYNEPNCGDAGMYQIKNGTVDFKKLPITEIYCCTNDNKSFVISNKRDVINTFEKSYLNNIVGGFLRECLLINGYTSENVINWNEDMNCFESGFRRQ